MPETRFVNCDTCGTEGAIEHGHPNAPDPDWVEVCPGCRGECVVEVEVEPIDLDDLPPPASPSEYPSEYRP
jgi:hypothetical protein